MSREIKFRAWDSKDNVMVQFGYDNFAVLGERVRNYALGYDSEGNYRKQENINYMQYTGLKDRHGVEIYEGDIIKYVTQYYGNKIEHRKVVEWIDDMQDDSFGEPLSMGYRFHGGDIEVIGNIYENSELLERTK